jgi:TetR/AcrR family transcriptional repressor of mexJK operon
MGGPVFELPDPSDGADLAEVERTLTDFGVRFLQFLLSETATRTFQLVTAEARRSPELARIFYEAGPQAGIARITRYLEAAKAAGLIAPPNCHDAALQLMSLCRGHLYFRYSLNLIAQPTAEEVKSEIAGSVSVFLGAYGVRAA